MIMLIRGGILTIARCRAVGAKLHLELTTEQNARELGTESNRGYCRRYFSGSQYAVDRRCSLRSIWCVADLRQVGSHRQYRRIYPLVRLGNMPPLRGKWCQIHQISDGQFSPMSSRSYNWFWGTGVKAAKAFSLLIDRTLLLLQFAQGIDPFFFLISVPESIAHRHLLVLDASLGL